MIYLYVSLGIVGGLALIFLFVWLNNSLLTVTGYSVEIGAEHGVKIVHLSDLHGKNFGRNNARLIKKIVGLKPDFIAITGDIIHKYRPRDIRVALNTVTALCEVAPVLYVAGNHEMRSTRYRFLMRDLQEAGAVVLDNCSRDICGLTVVGLNCASLKNNTLERLTAELDADNPKILLAHMPQFIENYAKFGYDLALCGHAHGGQWRIPFTGMGFYAPGQGLFPKLTSGIHSRGKTRMIVSRGLGNSECPLRLFNSPEIILINCN